MKPSEKATQKVKTYKGLGQVLEVCSVITLTCLLGLFWLSPEKVSRSLVAVAIIFVGLLFIGLAIYCAYSAAEVEESAMKDAQKEADSNTYVISNARIEILKEKGVPESVQSFLCNLISNDTPVGNKELDVSGEKALFIKGVDLATTLSDGLGSQIAGQFKDTIFKYTLKENKQPPPDAGDQAQAAPTPAETSGNSQIAQLKPDPVIV